MVLSSTPAHGRGAPALRAARLRPLPRAGLGAAPRRRAAGLPAGAGMSHAAASRSPTTTPRSRSAPAACPCSARRGCSRGARRPPAPRSSRPSPRARPSVGTRDPARAPRRQPGRRRGRGDRHDGVRRRAAAPVHRRRPAHRRDGKVVASGEVTRVVVDAERFLARISAVRAEPLRHWVDRSTRRSPWARPDASAAVARRRRPTTASAPTPDLEASALTAPSPSLRLGLVASALAAALALSFALAGCSGTDDSSPTAGPTEPSSTAAPSEALTTPATPSASAVAKVRHAGPPLHRTQRLAAQDAAAADRR